MQGTGIRGNRLYYYGNRAGYIQNGRATVDAMFQNDELAAWLREQQGLDVEFRDGVFDRLAAGARESGDPRDSPALKSCRIWQLKPEVDPLIKFIGYDELQGMKHGPPDPAHYRTAYDGEIDTNNLDEIYEKFNLNHPPGYTGHSLSISDVIELYDQDGSEFHYVDRTGFEEINFISPEQEPGQTMNM